MTTLTHKVHRPVTSIIAAMTYNQPQLIQSLANALHPYLLVIDNGSNPPIEAPSRTPHSVIRIPENRYFAGGWNYVMPFLDVDWVMMLNDDVTGITMDMIDDLINSAEEHSYAAISPAFNSPHSHMQVQGLGLHTVPSIDWVATLIRKDAWNEVEGFNADAFPGYGSDLDIAYRLKLLGYRLAVDDRHLVYHIGGAAAIAGGTQHIQGNVTSMNEALHKLYGVQDWMEFTRSFLA